MNFYGGIFQLINTKSLGKEDDKYKQIETIATKKK